MLCGTFVSILSVCIYVWGEGGTGLGRKRIYCVLGWSLRAAEPARSPLTVTSKYWCQIDFLFKQNLLVMNRSSFCMLEASLFCFQFWKIFCWIQNSKLTVFFNTLKMSLYCILYNILCIVCSKESGVILIFVPLYRPFFFFSGCF